MLKMKLLDLFSGAGGAAMGYHLAGFDDITGIDIKIQKRYPFKFIRADALEYLKGLIESGEIEEYDLIHASPPCQRYSKMTAKKYRGNHPDLIGPIRELLKLSGKPYVIENVENARRYLINPILLCGSMFCLKLWRHRYFEIYPCQLLLTPPCNHSFEPVLITGTTRRKPENGGRFEYTAQQCREASGLNWMTRKEMDEAIPPAYTQYIAQQFLTSLK